MSERFGEQTVRLIPLAARVLGWTPDTFWAATPADLAAALADPDALAAGMTRGELDHLLGIDHHG